MTEPTGPYVPPDGPPALPHFPPGSGYTVPGGGMPPPPGYDPLISPDFGGWFQRSMTIVRRGWRPLAVVQGLGAIVGFCVQAPIVVYSAFAMEDITEQAAESAETGEFDFGQLLALLGYTGLTAAASVLITAIVTIAAIYIAAAVAIGATPAPGAGVRWALRRALPLIGWQVLSGFLILIGLLLCILPGVYVIAVMVILPAVVLFERGGALPRCFQLFHGDFPTAAGRTATILGLTIAATGVSSVLGMIGNAAAVAALPHDTALTVGALIGAVFAVLAQGIIGVFQAPLTLTAYADLRARFEPLSTPMLCQHLGLLPPPPPAVPTTPGF